MFNRLKSFFNGVNHAQDITGFLTGDEGSGDGLITTEYKDKSSQLQANLGWVYAANQVIADDCSAVKLKLMHVMQDGDYEEVFNHEILSLIEDPNIIITARQLWNLYYSYLNLTGEVYILKLDRKGEPLLDSSVLPSALFPLPSHLCEFHVGKTNWLDSYITYNGVDYPIQAVLRDINPDPENIYRGMSVVRKASLTIDTDIQMKRWNNKLFKNGARPGVVVEVPDTLRDDAYKRLKQQFDEQYRGVGNAFNRVVLEGGAKLSPFMMTTQDLDFLESKRFTRDEILAMFKVSGSNLGITEDVNRSNAEAQEYAYTKRCVKPRLVQFTDFINKRLLKPIYGGEYIISFEDPVPDNVEMKLSECQAGVNNWLTIDEVRERYGLEALPNGDGAKLYVSMGSVPINELSAYTAPSNYEDNEDHDHDSHDDNDSPKDKTKRNEIGNAKVKDYTLKSAKYERMILRSARKMFNQQAQDVKDWLANHEKSLGSLITKKDWASDMVDWEEYKTLFSTELYKILMMIIEEIGTEAYNALVSNGLYDPYSTQITKYLNDVARKVSNDMNDETEKQIRATLAQGLRDNETLEELSSRIMGVFGNASTNRAWTIAQTESANAENYADQSAWEQSGVVEAKEWFTAEDERVCGFCAGLDGKIVSLHDNFYDKGDRVEFTDSKGHTHSMNVDYRTINTPTLHPNCRCVMLPVLIDKKKQ